MDKNLIEALRDWRLRVAGILFLFTLVFSSAFSPPRNFPEGEIVTLRKGAGLTELALELEQKNIIRSPIWFGIAVITLGGERAIQAEDYYLKKKQNGIVLAWRMVFGQHGLTEVKITVPEGFTNKEIASLFDNRFVMFDEKKFISSALEGYMFPDTYFIKISATTDDVLEMFRKNFEKKVSTFDAEIRNSKYSKEEILIMASILEGEVQTLEDKKIVAGILWKRHSIGMALQVDVDKKTYEIRGLPPKPLNNPGLDSINAALNPKSTEYFYYINSEDGTTHYAETLEEHIENIQKYL